MSELVFCGACDRYRAGEDYDDGCPEPAYCRIPKERVTYKCRFPTTYTLCERQNKDNNCEYFAIKQSEPRTGFARSFSLRWW